jgi:hypothetical protein
MTEDECPYGVHWCRADDRCRDCLHDIEDDFMLDTHDDPWEV